MTYRSPYVIAGTDRWAKQAMVRTRSHDVSVDAWNQKDSLFSSSLTPYLNHELLSTLKPSQRTALAALRVGDYLTKTEVVEIQIVNRSIEKILNEEWISDEIRSDALRVYTDEAYHAMMMADFYAQFYRSTGIKLNRRSVPELELIFNLLSAMPARFQDIAIICCAITTETLITATLRQAGKEALYAPIANLLLQHAEDEAKHQAFFLRFSEVYLPKLDDAERQFCGRLFPVVAWLFLCPSFQQIRDDISALGYDKNLATRVVNESYQVPVFKDQIDTAASVLRNLCKNMELTDFSFFDSQLEQVSRKPVLSLDIRDEITNDFKWD